MVISTLIGPIVRRFIGQQARNIHQTLRGQERLIDYTYKKTGLYNRGVVRGIKHGLVAGQIIGGGLQLGLSAPETPGNDAVPFEKQRKPSQTGSTYKTRRRFAVRRSRRYSKCYNRHTGNRYADSRRN